MNTEKIGIFGGTFNPPHKGHIRAAEAFIREMSLDRLIIMPDRIPPHKTISENDSPKIRLEMAHAAFDSVSDRITVSDYEINKDGVSYTFETLRHFKKENRILYLLCGTDMFLTLDKWREPAEIFRLSHIVCIKRDFENDFGLCEKCEYYERNFNAEISFLSVAPLEISSTVLREKIRNNENTDEFITTEVKIITEREKLYR